MKRENRHYRETSHATEAARLAALQRYAILDTPSEEEYDELAQLAAQVCAVPIALISLLDQTRQWFKSNIGLEIKQTARELAFCEHTIRLHEILEVTDASADPRFRANPLVTGEPGIRYYAGAPLITPDGHALGTLCVIDRRQRRLTEHQRHALLILARQVVNKLELRRLLTKAETELERGKLAEAQLQDQVGQRTQSLQTTLDRLRDTEVQLNSMFENAAVGLAALDGGSRLRRCNGAFRKLVKCTPDACLGRFLADLVEPAEQAALTELIFDTLNGQNRGWTKELRLHRQHSETQWVRLGVTPVLGGNDPDVRGIVFMQSVEHRKLAEYERDRFFELSAEMLVIAGRDGEIHRINPSCQRVLGLESDQLTGARLVERVEPEDQAALEQALQGLYREASAETVSIDLRMRDASDRVRTIRWSAVHWPGRERLIAAGRDVTDIIEAERALHELAARLQSIREEERTRISREIHDDLGQRLTALKMDLTMLQSDLGAGGANDKRSVLEQDVQSIIDLTDTTLVAVRRIAQELRPDVLDVLGLVPGIEWLLQDIENRTGLKCILDAPESIPRLPDKTTTVFFRIAQEALTNVVRHAHARSVRIKLTLETEALALSIEDDGQGFVDNENKDISLGLLGMRERAAGIGGSIEFENISGQGACVRLRLPMHAGRKY